MPSAAHPGKPGIQATGRESCKAATPGYHTDWRIVGVSDASGCGRSSGVEHNLAKVGVEGSNPFARSNKIN
jgi:hypothetical protein